MKIEDKDIATIEAAHDMLLEEKIVDFDSRNLKELRTLASRMYKHLGIDSKENLNMIEGSYDKDGNAKHYDSQRLNSIIKFERTYGTLAVMTFCEINADKYRERIGKKKDQPIEQELLKIQWYEKAAAFYYNNILGTKLEIIIDNYKKNDLPWK